MKIKMTCQMTAAHQIVRLRRGGSAPLMCLLFATQYVGTGSSLDRKNAILGT